MVGAVSGGEGAAAGGEGAATGGGGVSRRVVRSVGLLARASRVPGRYTIELPAGSGPKTTYVVLRHGASQSTVKISMTAIT